MNNEKELLNLYTAKDDYRPVLQHPFLQDGKVCATDGYMLIRIDAAKCDGEYSDKPEGLTPPITAPVIPTPNTSEPLTRQQLEEALRQAPEEESRKCPDCGGSGLVQWEYTSKIGERHTRYEECPVCDGSGEVATYTAITCQFTLHGSPFCRHILEVLLRTMKLLGTDTLTIIAGPWEQRGLPTVMPILLAADGVEILAMPQLRSDRLKEIKIKKERL